MERQSFFLPNLGLRLTLSGLDPGIFRGAQRAFFLEQPSSGNAGISGVFPQGYGGRKTTELLHTESRNIKIDSVKGLDIDFVKGLHLSHKYERLAINSVKKEREASDKDGRKQQQHGIREIK